MHVCLSVCVYLCVCVCAHIFVCDITGIEPDLHVHVHAKGSSTVTVYSFTLDHGQGLVNFLSVSYGVDNFVITTVTKSW